MNPYFQTQWNGATAAVLFRGAYHIARPNLSSGAIQANFFLTHGGVWTKDGRTLPGAVEFVGMGHQPLTSLGLSTNRNRPSFTGQTSRTTVVVMA